MDWYQWQIKTKGSCEYCERPFTSSNRKTIDHIIPKGKGGSYKKETWNLIAACIECNSRKGNYISYSIGWVIGNRELLIEDIKSNKLKIRIDRAIVSK